MDTSPLIRNVAFIAFRAILQVQHFIASLSDNDRLEVQLKVSHKIIVFTISQTKLLLLYLCFSLFNTAYHVLLQKATAHAHLLN